MPRMSAGPVVILTGASSGIGAAVAVELGRAHGARVAMLARRADKLAEVAEDVRAAGGEAFPISCDVVDVEAVRRAVAEAEEEAGPIEVAIANAGIGAPVPMHRFDADRCNRIMRVNFEW